MAGDKQAHMMLQIMRTDLLSPGAARRKVEAGARLLVTLLDPSLRSPCAPMSSIKLDGRPLRQYNEILKETQDLRAKFYGRDSFINNPTRYTPDRQKDVFKTAADIGLEIADLFHTNDHASQWLKDLFQPATETEGGEEPLPPVTIITNDLEIPWFWLRHKHRFLCEVCSLGTLHLSATDGPGESSRGHRRRENGQALLIKGARTQGYPFLDEDLERIKRRLEEPSTSVGQNFSVSQAATGEDIERICPRFGARKPSYPNIRIVHYSGHYSGDQLFLSGVQVPIAELGRDLADWLLVLDASSDGGASDVWADIDGLTPALSKNALGCIVTALPVKDDPIVNRVLWDTFYRNLRCETETVGSALAKARIALRDYFASIGSSNPAWTAYQLIGSPVVRLCDGVESRR